MSLENEAPPNGSHHSGVQAGRQPMKAPPRKCSGADFHTSSRLRRCPWFADVVRLAAEPARSYSAWRGTAILCAGSNAWDDAAPIREAGRRAVTVLPPGTDPAAVIWPAVPRWHVAAGDLEAGDAIKLGRLLIDYGAKLVVISGERISCGAGVRRAPHGD